MEPWWNRETATVRPYLYPVEELDIRRLETILELDRDLRDFWLMNGYGFFIQGADGGKVEDAAANRLLHPDDVLELIEGTAEFEEEYFAAGMPFFNTIDREYLFVDAEGRIVGDGAKELVVVAGSFRKFMERLMEAPLFYEELLG